MLDEPNIHQKILQCGKECWQSPSPHRYYTYTLHELGTDPVSPCSQVSFTAIHCLLFVWRANSRPVRGEKKKEKSKQKKAKAVQETWHSAKATTSELLEWEPSL